MVLPFIRQAGDWNKEIKVYSTGLQYNSFYVIMEDVGEVNNLSEVTKNCLRQIILIQICLFILMFSRNMVMP